MTDESLSFIRLTDLKIKQSSAQKRKCVSRSPNCIEDYRADVEADREDVVELLALDAILKHLGELDRLNEVGYGPLLALTIGIEVFTRTLSRLEAET